MNNQFNIMNNRFISQSKINSNYLNKIGNYLNNIFIQNLEQFVQSLRINVDFLPAPIKKSSRIIEKIYLNKKRLNKINDIIRASLVCDNLEDTFHVINQLFNYFGINDCTMEVNKQFFNANKLTTENNINSMQQFTKLILNDELYSIKLYKIKISYFSNLSNYGDIKLLLIMEFRNSYYICELQILTRSMYEAKSLGHTGYKVARTVKSNSYDTFNIAKKYYDLKGYLDASLEILNNRNLINGILSLKDRFENCLDIVSSNIDTKDLSIKNLNQLKKNKKKKINNEKNNLKNEIEKIKKLCLNKNGKPKKNITDLELIDYCSPYWKWVFGLQNHGIQKTPIKKSKIPKNKKKGILYSVLKTKNPSFTNLNSLI